MSGVGPTKHTVGFMAIEDELAGDGSVWVVERRSDDGWTEVERTGDRASAQEALDQLAASERVELSDLRIRELG
jgi:hypothetical protein